MSEKWTWGDEDKIVEKEVDTSPSFKYVVDLLDYERSEEISRLSNYLKMRTLRQKIVDLIRRR